MSFVKTFSDSPSPLKFRLQFLSLVCCCDGLFCWAVLMGCFDGLFWWAGMMVCYPPHLPIPPGTLPSCIFEAKPSCTDMRKVQICPQTRFCGFEMSTLLDVNLQESVSRKRSKSIKWFKTSLFLSFPKHFWLSFDF